jgi:enoyl-CoA hydratase/carnithine racemase
MTSSAIIKYEKEKYVAVLTIAQAFTTDSEKMSAMADELSELRIRIMSDEETRVIVLTSLGYNEFSMGEDLTQGLSFESVEGTRVIAEQIAGIDRPVIAGITGNAIGIGLELALACDIRIATETSHFGLSQVREGLIPSDGGSQRLPRLVGKGEALEMLLTGDVIDAQESLRIGLVNKIVTSQELRETVMAMAHEMASKAPLALRYAKETVHKGMDLNLEQGLRLEADLYLLLHTTQDRTKGIKAFQERQDVQFEGR